MKKIRLAFRNSKVASRFTRRSSDKWLPSELKHKWPSVAVKAAKLHAVDASAAHTIEQIIDNVLAHLTDQTRN